MTTDKTNQPQPDPIDPVAGKSVAEIFGEIVWLMSQDKVARELPIKDLEHLVMPGILLRQFHIQYARNPNANDALVPVSVEVFAMCSEAVATALAAHPGVRLTMQDWRSGGMKIIIFSIGQSKP